MKTGIFGTNLAIATHKVRKAPTPAEQKFRASLMADKNAGAAEIVDRVDFVMKSMQNLDASKHDLNKADGAVRVDAQADKLGSFGRWRQGINSPLNAITTQAPKATQKPQVSGFLTEEGDMSVTVQHSPDQSTSFAQATMEDGSKIFRAGGDTVRMNADGTLMMG